MPSYMGVLDGQLMSFLNRARGRWYHRRARVHSENGELEGLAGVAVGGSVRVSHDKCVKCCLLRRKRKRKSEAKGREGLGGPPLTETVKRNNRHALPEILPSAATIKETQRRTIRKLYRWMGKGQGGGDAQLACTAFQRSFRPAGWAGCIWAAGTPNGRSSVKRLYQEKTPSFSDAQGAVAAPPTGTLVLHFCSSQPFRRSPSLPALSPSQDFHKPLKTPPSTPLT